MGSSPRWRGIRDIVESKESPVFDNNEKGPKWTLVFGGPFDILLAKMPVRLQTISGYGGFFVDTVNLRKTPGGTGALTVTLTPAPIEDFTFGSNEVIEVDWAVLEKKIETHAVFNAASTHNRGPKAGQYQLRADDWTKIREWKAADPGAVQDGIYAGASKNAQVFLNLLIAGTDSYQVFAPVIRRTRKYAEMPDVEECGIFDDPPISVGTGDYDWLKTADRLTRDRTWTRIEEWTGADHISDVLYSY